MNKNLTKLIAAVALIGVFSAITPVTAQQAPPPAGGAPKQPPAGSPPPPPSRPVGR